MVGSKSQQQRPLPGPGCAEGRGLAYSRAELAAGSVDPLVEGRYLRKDLIPVRDVQGLRGLEDDHSAFAVTASCPTCSSSAMISCWRTMCFRPRATAASAWAKWRVSVCGSFRALPWWRR